MPLGVPGVWELSTTDALLWAWMPPFPLTPMAQQGSQQGFALDLEGLMVQPLSLSQLPGQSTGQQEREGLLLGPPLPTSNSLCEDLPLPRGSTSGRTLPSQGTLPSAPKVGPCSESQGQRLLLTGSKATRHP